MALDYPTPEFMENKERNETDDELVFGHALPRIPLWCNTLQS
jgi:hypothetical protein